MKTEIVTILKVDQYGVTYTNGLGASRENFPDVKPGQIWEVTTTDKHPDFHGAKFSLGSIVSTRLIEDVK